MTNEQIKTIDRCKSMIKRAFPEMTGKFIFRLDHTKSASKGISVDMFMPSIKLNPDLRSEN